MLLPFILFITLIYRAYFDGLIRSSLIFTTDTVVLHFRAAITGKRRAIRAEPAADTLWYQTHPEMLNWSCCCVKSAISDVQVFYAISCRHPSLEAKQLRLEMLKLNEGFVLAHEKSPVCFVWIHHVYFVHELAGVHWSSAHRWKGEDHLGSLWEGWHQRWVCCKWFFFFFFFSPHFLFFKLSGSDTARNPEFLEKHSGTAEPPLCLMIGYTDGMQLWSVSVSHTANQLIFILVVLVWRCQFKLLNQYLKYLFIFHHKCCI